MSVDAKTPVAVLGQGSIGRRHARLLLEIGCEVAIFDPVVQSEPSAGAVRNDDEADVLRWAAAAVIASPTSEHAEQARRALASGCHVLVEKPLAISAAEADGILEAANAARRALAVAMNWRFHPGPAGVRAAIAAGEIGEPLVAHVTCGSYLPGWRPGVDYRETYSAQRALGGGVLLDAVHELDYTCWALGAPLEVDAWLGHVSQLELDVEDVALLRLRFAGGAVATIALDYLDRSYRRGCRVVGTEASVEWRHDDGAVSLSKGELVERRPIDSDIDATYRRQLECFLEVVSAAERLDATPLAGAGEGLAALAVIDAARESSDKRAPVAVAYPRGAGWRAAASP